jgi:protein CpxP
MRHRSLSRMVAVVALLGAPVAAFAQTAAPAHPARSTTEQALLRNQSANVDAHITLLHRELQITPAEETQWAAFAQVMRDNAAQMDAAFSQRGGALATMNAVQDLQSYAQISQIQSDNMQKLATAFQTLYASFPASQQKVVDGVFRPAQVRH